MEKRIVIALVLAGVGCMVNAGDFSRYSRYGDIATGQATVSSQYAGKVAPGTPLGEQADTQMQKVEAMGQERLQATQPMQRVQQVKTQAQQPMQQPTEAIKTRFGGGKFF